MGLREPYIHSSSFSVERSSESATLLNSWRHSTLDMYYIDWEKVSTGVAHGILRATMRIM